MGGEAIDFVELAFDKALRMSDEGSIDDAKTIVLLRWPVLRGPFARARSELSRGPRRSVGHGAT